MFLWADASGLAVAAILVQTFEDGQKHPIAFWSRKLIPAERNYGIPDIELLAIWASMMTWRRYLEGVNLTITVYSDHVNLRTFNTTMNLNRRQVRWSLDLQRFDFLVEHLPGKNNPADAPSRRLDYKNDSEDDGDVLKPFLRFALTLNLTLPPVPDEVKATVREVSKVDEEILDLYNSNVPGKWQKTEDELYYWNNRLFIPDSCRRDVMRRGHGAPLAGHFGVHKTYDILTRSYYWPRMRESIEELIKHCREC